jgi:hypothetical protein
MMKSENWKLEQVWSGIGWGLFLILVGSLFLADNRGWLHRAGWSYFAIGLGAILVAGFLFRYFGTLVNRWSGVGGLATGLALIFVGIASFYGFGEWWPVILLAIGIGSMVKGFLQNKTESRRV